MRILVTGGSAGFIGSHTSLELLKAGHDVIVVDNLSNSKPEGLRRVQELAGRPLRFEKIDLLDRDGLDRVFRESKPEAVIHFAGLKAVGESVAQPRRYYMNNVVGTLVLTEIMERHGVKLLVFSSSATVYGDPATVPVQEHFPLSATNPYGQSKLIIEIMLRDLAFADPTWRIALLRYFNPVGAHESGLIGEDPNGTPAIAALYTPRSRSASCLTSGCSGMITPPPTAPESATTSTSWTSQKVISRRWSGFRR